jgi:hypothetical protein
MIKNILSIGLLLPVLMWTVIVQAATGEWWEVSTKMEMAGMPFAMPAQATKVCIPKGGEKDPRYTQGNDRNCKMTDVKQSGDTVKFKGSCVNRGETMNMVGETTHSGSSFKTNLKMSGKSGGEKVDMAMTSTGKRIGGACDTEAMGKKAQAQIDAGMAKACDSSKFTTIEWINSASLYLGKNAACPGKSEMLCKAVRNDVPKNVNAFEALQASEKNKDQPSIVKACNLNLASISKTLCKAKARSGPLHFLEANCPAEAKAFRELQRKQEECEGRGFTSGAKMKSCMGGQMIEAESAQERPKKSGKSSSNSSDSSESGNEAVREGTKALKGLFGF